MGGVLPAVGFSSHQGKVREQAIGKECPAVTASLSGLALVSAVFSFVCMQLSLRIHPPREPLEQNLSLQIKNWKASWLPRGLIEEPDPMCLFHSIPTGPAGRAGVTSVVKTFLSGLASADSSSPLTLRATTVSYFREAEADY